MILNPENEKGNCRSSRYGCRDNKLRLTKTNGIRICQSDDGVSIDQTPYAKEIVASVLGKDWDTKLPPGTKHSIPLPAGTEFEASLASETPFDIAALAAAEQKFGFKYRSVLCAFMHLGLWTRPDLMPSLIRLSRFQSAPGHIPDSDFGDRGRHCGSG